MVILEFHKDINDGYVLGTLNVLAVKAPASQPVGTFGVALPTFKSVKTAGQMVNGHALYTVNVRAATAAEPMSTVLERRVAIAFMAEEYR